jgi:hypothetical protein
VTCSKHTFRFVENEPSGGFSTSIYSTEVGAEHFTTGPSSPQSKSVKLF